MILNTTPKIPPSGCVLAIPTNATNVLLGGLLENVPFNPTKLEPPEAVPRGGRVGEVVGIAGDAV